jgi:lactate dehydrogenase-like 2-hydroxyacid dehydrogenase
VEFARRAIGFAPAAILYNKRTPYPAEVERDLHITYATQDEIAARADVLISLLPYAPETDSSLNKAFFEKVKPGAVLVHAGSGSVIDELALLDALTFRRLAGAALDTYEFEPLQPDHPLVMVARFPGSNLLLTPHTAAASVSPSRADDYAAIVEYLKKSAG